MREVGRGTTSAKHFKFGGRGLTAHFPLTPALKLNGRNGMRFLRAGLCSPFRILARSGRFPLLLQKR